MSRVMVDLFCGRGGWTKGFLAHGWHCIGIDLNPQPDYPGEFIQADIAQLLELPAADFYCCSSPCEQFSVHGLPFFKNPAWPWLGIALFDYARQLIHATGKPYVMENVRTSQRFLGNADFHCGPFYLWGNLPVLWPRELRQLRKGISFPRDPATGKRELVGLRATFSWEKDKRAQISAQYAEIPFAPSSYIAQKGGAA